MGASPTKPVSRPPRFSWLLLGPFLWGLVALGDLMVLPGAGEPLLARWARKLAEHPVRGSLALALLVLALRPAHPRAPIAHVPGSPAVESSDETR